MASPEYPKTPVNKLGRLANRAAYDYATIHTLVNTCPILHVSFVDPEHPFPVVLPMIGCTGNFSSPSSDPASTSQDLYIHGYVSGRIFKSGKNADGQGLPITVAASFLDNMLPQRWDKSRTPPTPAELKSTSILRIRIESASAKIRTGGPSEDRADLKNAELVKKTWTGVVPYWGTWGEPVPGKENGCEDVESYIEGWRMKETGQARGYAFEAIEMDGKKK